MRLNVLHAVVTESTERTRIQLAIRQRKAATVDDRTCVETAPVSLPTLPIDRNFNPCFFSSGVYFVSLELCCSSPCVGGRSVPAFHGNTGVVTPRGATRNTANLGRLQHPVKRPRARRRHRATGSQLRRLRMRVLLNGLVCGRRWN